MFMFLSHPLDPEGYAWPGEPVVKTTQCTDVSDDCPFCSFVSELPNHCLTNFISSKVLNTRLNIIFPFTTEWHILPKHR